MIVKIAREPRAVSIEGDTFDALNRFALAPQPGTVVEICDDDGTVLASSDPTATDQQKALMRALNTHVANDREPINRLGRRPLKTGGKLLDAAAVAVAVAEISQPVGGQSIVFRAPAAVSRAVMRAPRPVRQVATVGALTVSAIPPAVGTASLWYSGALVLLADDNVQAGIQWLASLLW